MSNESPTIQFASREDRKAVEEALLFAPKFDDRGLIPVTTTNATTGEVLMTAYMNAEAIGQTLEIGEAVYWSRSRSCLWHKGATSGHTQKVVDFRIDCDQDSLWLSVTPEGPGSCHTGHRSCYYRRLPNREEFAALNSGDPLPLIQAENSKAFDPNSVYKS
jgi:phosphoribosyl-AMP cyclohydrolase